MKVCHTLICFFLLFSLQDGSTGLVSAQLFVYSGIEGEDVRVECSIPSYRSRKLFCKETCEYGNILIEITDAPAQRGKYRIDYVDGYSFVTITQLTKSDSGRYSIDQLTQSDSGWYRCGLGRPDSKDPYRRFRLIVTDGRGLVKPKNLMRKHNVLLHQRLKTTRVNTYSEIKFVSVGSSQSGFHGDAECVFYSVPLVEASSDEPPLYSTVNNPQ
ncbi:Polymeric immunoglobulin receptor [Dissostichus eleginoides]|nr:Polymeric immunoglobulin receptor [Dissostichus eleginoides]